MKRGFIRIILEKGFSKLQHRKSEKEVGMVKIILRKVCFFTRLIAFILFVEKFSCSAGFCPMKIGSFFSLKLSNRPTNSKGATSIGQQTKRATARDHTTERGNSIIRDNGNMQANQSSERATETGQPTRVHPHFRFGSEN